MDIATEYKQHSRVILHDDFMPLAHTSFGVRTDLIKHEAMFFRASPAFAEEKGDLLTEDFLKAAKSLWGDLDGCIIDSRHHMLMPGMIPCIPGWHTDDSPREPNRWSGQPDIFDPEYTTEHLLCVIDAGTDSLTEFRTGAVILDRHHFEKELSHGANFYKTADYLFESVEPASTQKRIQVRPGQIAEFNSNSWHRGQPAKSRGFRWFIRITRNSRHKVENELRSNAQVYITDTSYGW